MRKLQQLWNVVRESHRAPIAGTHHPVPLVTPTETAITFIGHSSFLIQLAGRNVLIDPVFAHRLILLRRQRRPGVRLKDLPPIDAVLLTHAHMDHLNLPSLRRIIRHTRRLTGHAPEVIVPRNVSDLVTKLGFRKITELEWWQSATLCAVPYSFAASLRENGAASFEIETQIETQIETERSPVTITMTPAKHWGARMFQDTHRHYGGYVVATATQSIYHSGDTAYFPGFREIGQRLHPQIALLPIGAYFPDSYRAVHTSPEEALQAFLDLGAVTMIPMHFGTFPLGKEPMDEPPVRLISAAERIGIANQIRILREGETTSL